MHRLIPLCLSSNEGRYIKHHKTKTICLAESKLAGMISSSIVYFIFILFACSTIKGWLAHTSRYFLLKKAYTTSYVVMLLVCKSTQIHRHSHTCCSGKPGGKTLIYQFCLHCVCAYVCAHTHAFSSSTISESKLSKHWLKAIATACQEVILFGSRCSRWHTNITQHSEL